MKMEMNSTNRTVVAVVALLVLVGIFWTQLLSPKRDEASKLDAQAKQLEASVSQHEAEIAEAEAAKKEFPVDYQHLVVVGKAVPGSDETASLLVQMNRLADGTGGTFRDIKLSASGEGQEAPPSAASGEGEPASPTEVAASLLPLGATVGPAGLAVMPYEVTFSGNFFQIADYIKGLDSMVKTNGEKIVVDGRLVTIDGFALEAAPKRGFPDLKASFALTTYLTPPEEAASTGTALETTEPLAAAPAAATIGAAP